MFKSFLKSFYIKFNHKVLLPPSLQDETASARKLVHLIQALEEVQRFHELESNMQVMQYLMEIRRDMYQMIRNMNIKEDILINLQIIGDISYAWELIDAYTPIMQFGMF